MSQYLTAMEELFETDFVSGIESHRMIIDPAYKELVASSERVVQDDVTYDYKVIHKFATSLAGNLRAASRLGPEMMANTGATRVITAPDSYPGRQDMVLPGIDNYTLHLAKQKGAIYMNSQQFKAQGLATAGDYPALILQMYAKAVAHQSAVDWFINDSAQVVELDNTGAGASIVRVGNVCTVTKPNANDSVLVAGTGPLRRIMPGLHYDLWSHDMATCYTQNGWALLTSQVDYYGASTITLLFQSAVDAAAYAATSAASDSWMVPYSAIADRTAAGSNLSRMPCGWQSWVRATGTLFGAFGNLTVENYGSLFKSHVKNIGGNLTEHGIITNIRLFERATGVSLDTILTTGGVIVDLLNTYGLDAGAGVVRILREGGKASDLDLGTEAGGDIGFRIGTKVYRFLDSDLMTPGYALVTKFGDSNQMRYEPPALSNLHSEGQVVQGGIDTRIEWTGKLTGDSIWVPVSEGGAPSDDIAAPFDIWFQHAPKEPRCVLLTGCTEA